MSRVKLGRKFGAFISSTHLGCYFGSTRTSKCVLSGLVKEETAKVVVVQTPTEVIRVLASDIEKRETKPISLMPEGIFATLSDRQVRDLLAYLAGKGQVALPK